MHTPRRRYDHRIRDAVVEGRELALIQKFAIPAYTRRSWRRRGSAPVVALHSRDAELRDLETRIARLERRVARLRAMVRVLIALVRAGATRLDAVRLPSGKAKARLLRSIDNAREFLGKHTACRLTGLTDGRLRAWRRREIDCALDDAPPCPRLFPHRLTRESGPSSVISSWRALPSRPHPLACAPRGKNRPRVRKRTYVVQTHQAERVATAAYAHVPAEGRGRRSREPPE